MPAIRWQSFTHPVTGQDGIWCEPNWLPYGTVRGLARADWPGPLVGETPAEYSTRINAQLATLVAKGITNPIRITLTVISLAPITLDPDIGFVISERDSVSHL